MCVCVGGSFLQVQVLIDDVLCLVNLMFVNVVLIGDDWEVVLKDVCGVIVDVMMIVLSQVEVDCEYVDFDIIMCIQVEIVWVEVGVVQVDDMVGVFDICEMVVGLEIFYDILKDVKVKGMFMFMILFVFIKWIFEGIVICVLVNIKIFDLVVVIKLVVVLSVDVSKFGGMWCVQVLVDFFVLLLLGMLGIVILCVKIVVLDMEQVNFVNGICLLLFFNIGEIGCVYVCVWFGCGYNVLLVNKLMLVWVGDFVLVVSGVGKFDQGDFDQLIVGWWIGFDFDIGDDVFLLLVIILFVDYVDQLKLMVVKFVFLGWDFVLVVCVCVVMLVQFVGYDLLFDGVLLWDLEGLLCVGDLCWVMLFKVQVEKLMFKDFCKFWELILVIGLIEVLVFGDIKIEEVVIVVVNIFGVMILCKVDMVRLVFVCFFDYNVILVMCMYMGFENQVVVVIVWLIGGGIDGIIESW